MSEPTSTGPTDTGDAVYELTLFIAGQSPLSRRAAASLQNLCRRHLTGRHQLRILDVHENPEVAAAAGVLVLPTLLRSDITPTRRYVGDMTRTDQILVALAITAPRPPNS